MALDKEAKVMKKLIRFVLFYGGDEDPTRNKTLRKLSRKLLKGARERGAETEFVDLAKYKFKAQNAKPTRKVNRRLVALVKKLKKADIVAHATCVHWGKPSTETAMFIDQVEAPLEWSGSNELRGWQCWGKVFVMLSICDDDGASAVNATTIERGIHRGLFPFGWGSHYKNLRMSKSEHDWQDRPEVAGRIAVEFAKRISGFPHWSTFIK